MEGDKKRIYEYICNLCDKYFTLYRPEAARRDDDICPECGGTFNGELSKRICVAPEIRYGGRGKLKGNMNSQGR